MPAFARVIVEKRDDLWSAHFGDEPETSFCGHLPTQAMQHLLEVVGGGQFEESTVQPVCAATREGHLEFLATYRSPSRTDATALNDRA
jgi:hypothetical protein